MQDNYGFVYLWYDRKHNRFYIGCHWGHEDDGYVCSSQWMKRAHKVRPRDFKRRILKTGIPTKKQMFEEEHEFLKRIKPHELRTKYYNLHAGAVYHWSAQPNASTIAQKSGNTRRGRPLGPCSEEKRRAISEGKKRAFAKRRAETGSALTPAHAKALKNAAQDRTLSEAHKASISKGLKKAYANGRNPGGRPGRRKVVLCGICNEDTGSPRRQYCADHRYDGMNITRAQKVGSKWAQPQLNTT